MHDVTLVIDICFLKELLGAGGLEGERDGVGQAPPRTIAKMSKIKNMLHALNSILAHNLQEALRGSSILCHKLKDASNGSSILASHKT